MLFVCNVYLFLLSLFVSEGIICFLHYLFLCIIRSCALFISGHFICLCTFFLLYAFSLLCTVYFVVHTLVVYMH